MALYSNFNVKELEDLRERSEKVFTSILENVRTIKNECGNMSDIVSSDDSNLALRWRNFYESMDSPINNIEDTFVIIKTLLNTYIENTKANEQKAVKELEALDEEINSLASRAESLLNGLFSLKGVGFGATAIAIPGLHFIGGSGEPIAVTKYAPPSVDDPIAVTKYAPPSVDDPVAVTKYAPPSFDDPIAVTKYAPPSIEDPIAVTKYAPPSFDDPIAVTKYAPPSFGDPIAVTKYAPPSFVEPIAVTKYAPPSWGQPIAVTKYAPPNIMDGKSSGGNVTNR